MPEKYLTAEEVAEMVHAAAETVRFWRHRGVGPKYFRPKGSRRVLYAESDVQAWLQAARDETK